MTDDPLRGTGRTTRIVLSALTTALSGRRTFLVFKTRNDQATWLDWVCELPFVPGARDTEHETIGRYDTLRFHGGGSLTMVHLLGGVGVKFDGSFISLHNRDSYERFADDRTDRIYADHTLNLAADIGEEVCP